MRYKGQTTYQHADNDKPAQKMARGVLLTNLGTPDEATPKALRRYLKEFLSDPRVVELPRLLWWCILHFFILPFRPRKSAKLYQQVWTEQGSPLLTISQSQAKLLQQQVDQHFGQGDIFVAVGMRYGNPSIADALEQLTQRNVRNITVLPLFPQYCAATTGATFDAIAKALTQYRWVPELKFINDYHQHKSYIRALCNSIKQHIEQRGMPQRLVFSYHGTPKRYLLQGDPYHCFCLQTTRLVTEQLAIAPDVVITCFQSRFGKEEWLTPYTDETLQQLPSTGIHDVAIICPGFAADCLETLEEIEVENRQLFLNAGGKEYHYIPCLNDSTDSISTLFDVVKQHLSTT